MFNHRRYIYEKSHYVFNLHNLIAIYSFKFAEIKLHEILTSIPALREVSHEE